VLFGFFDYRISILHISLGILIGVLGGFTIDKLKLEKYVETFVYKIKNANVIIPKMNQLDRFAFAKQETLDILKRVYK